MAVLCPVPPLAGAFLPSWALERNAWALLRAARGASSAAAGAEVARDAARLAAGRRLLAQLGGHHPPGRGAPREDASVFGFLHAVALLFSVESVGAAIEGALSPGSAAGAALARLQARGFQPASFIGWCKARGLPRTPAEAGAAAAARAAAALRGFDRGKASATALARALLDAAGPRALASAVDLGAPLLVPASLAPLLQRLREWEEVGVAVAEEEGESGPTDFQGLDEDSSDGGGVELRGGAEEEAPRKMCGNCGADETRVWRRRAGLVLCNACGMFLQKRGAHRPAALVEAHLERCAARDAAPAPPPAGAAAAAAPGGGRGRGAAAAGPGGEMGRLLELYSSRTSDASPVAAAEGLLRLRRDTWPAAAPAAAFNAAAAAPPSARGAADTEAGTWGGSGGFAQRQPAACAPMTGAGEVQPSPGHAAAIAAALPLLPPPPQARGLARLAGGGAARGGGRMGRRRTRLRRRRGGRL
ncbi:MAG: hypothetical protein J3K34DRAFT_486571 [Monoraphidium minutum]|nr:MAG: hypothetical protein J3K34DRAFT_486571 [Monoraphidium minutum]